MRERVISLAGFAAITCLAASPAFAGEIPAPEPEVAGGIAALAALGVAVRVLRGRFRR